MINVVDLPNFVEIFPWVAAFLGVVVVSLIVYVFWWRPRVREPLPNEMPLGSLTIYLPRGIGLKQGYACTAGHTLERYYHDVIEHETDSDQKTSLQKGWDLFKNLYALAHRVEGELFLYLFDKNPLDEKYMDVDPYTQNGRIITGVQDAVSGGKVQGATVIAVKLSTETQTFSDDQKKQIDGLIRVAEYLRDAAVNTFKISDLKRNLDHVTKDRDKIRNELAETNAVKDRAVSALGKKPLTQPEGAKVPGEFAAKLKEWFSGWQVAIAIVAYLVAPYIARAANLPLDPNMNAYFNIAVAAFGFLMIPIGRKLFGRWL